jgi:dTDP-4-dehydrorhamnose reductase
MKVLIIGGDSLIGNYLEKFIINELGFNVTKTSRRENISSNEIFFDLRQEQEISLIENYDFAVICAGITNIRYCQENQDEAKHVNLINIIRLIDTLIQNRCHVIFLSSNLVFSGEKAFYDKDDLRNPKTIYGDLKKQVEDYLLEACPASSSILRLTKVLPDRLTAYQPWQKEVIEGNTVTMYVDTYISPVMIEEVGDVVANLLRDKLSGIFQLGGYNEISNFDFAISWATQNNLDVTLIKPSLNHDPRYSQHNSLLRVIP